MDRAPVEAGAALGFFKTHEQQSIETIQRSFKLSHLCVKDNTRASLAITTHYQHPQTPHPPDDVNTREHRPLSHRSPLFFRLVIVHSGNAGNNVPILVLRSTKGNPLFFLGSRLHTATSRQRIDQHSPFARTTKATDLPLSSAMPSVSTLPSSLPLSSAPSTSVTSSRQQALATSQATRSRTAQSSSHRLPVVSPSSSLARTTSGSQRRVRESQYLDDTSRRRSLQVESKPLPSIPPEATSVTTKPKHSKKASIDMTSPLAIKLDIKLERDGNVMNMFGGARTG